MLYGSIIDVENVVLDSYPAQLVMTWRREGLWLRFGWRLSESFGLDILGSIPRRQTSPLDFFF